MVTVIVVQMANVSAMRNTLAITVMCVDVWMTAVDTVFASMANAIATTDGKVIDVKMQQHRRHYAAHQPNHQHFVAILHVPIEDSSMSKQRAVCAKRNLSVLDVRQVNFNLVSLTVCF